MREQPGAAELVEAVAGFLRDEAMPALAGRLAFHARVAANALDIVARELALGPAAAAGERDRLRALLSRDGEPADLNGALCNAIRDGSIPAADPALVAHLWAAALDAVAVDQPGYETYRRARAAASDGET